MTTVMVDTRDLDRFIHDLERARKSALPYAMRNAINAGAFEGRRQWVRELRGGFILRNTYTERSLQVVKATSLRLDAMHALLGAYAPYLRKQEEGGTERGGGRSKPIPTAVAAGQPMGSRPRTKAVRRPNWLSAIILSRKRIGSTEKQRNAIAIQRTILGGRRFVLLELGRKRGIFLVTGRKRLQVRLVWDLSRKSVRIRPTPTLQRTLDAIDHKLPMLYAASVLEQLRRHRVLGY